MSITISGPVDISILRYTNIKIILLSDRHFSSEGICDMKCVDEDPEDSTASCYTVSGLIDRVIKHANRNGQYVDIYLEAMFLVIKAQRRLERVKERALQTEPKKTVIRHPLTNTIVRYSNCLYDRTACPYDNARFHYVDQRRQLVGDELLNGVEEFVLILSKRYTPNFFIDQEDTPRAHFTFFYFDFVISTFLNTPKFIDSNLRTYYDLMITSDNFAADVESYLKVLLVMDDQYIEDTINLLAYRYPEYSQIYIELMVNNWVDSTFLLIRKSLSSFGYVTEHVTSINGVTHRRVLHKIRRQLLGLELQGDNERAESLRQFIYRKLSAINLSPSVEYFKAYNNARMTYIITKDVSVFSSLDDMEPPFIHPNTYYVHIDALMVDLYTLARMFRTFPVQYQNKNKTIKYHVSPSYIIEYAGGAHINNVIEYFISIGAQREYFATNSEGKRCLRVPSNVFD